MYRRGGLHMHATKNPKIIRENSHKLYADEVIREKIERANKEKNLKKKRKKIEVSRSLFADNMLIIINRSRGMRVAKVLNVER